MEYINNQEQAIYLLFTPEIVTYTLILLSNRNLEQDFCSKYCSFYIPAEIEMCGGGERGGGGSEDEPYEDATPLHGDKLFHAFLTRLRNNPGQILRFILILSHTI